MTIKEIKAQIRHEGDEFRADCDSLKQINSSFNWERAELVKRISQLYPDRVKLVRRCSACESGQPHSGCSDRYLVGDEEVLVYSGALA